MPSLIPTFPDVANYSIGTVLDGTAYTLTFRLSPREASYFCDLALTDGTALVSGKRVVCNVDLFGRQRYNPLVPQGVLFCWPSQGLADTPPGLGELGKGRRCKLWYFTAAELAAVP
jgi:hypothetical protein